MKKALLFLPIAFVLFSCASATANKEELSEEAHYSLMKKIYHSNDKKLESIVRVNEPYFQTLNSPLYVKVYHGSYKDSQGNVINGGFMWLKLSSGKPKTNF